MPLKDTLTKSLYKPMPISYVSNIASKSLIKRNIEYKFEFYSAKVLFFIDIEKLKVKSS